MEIKLSKRLEKIAEFVDKSRIADIGCDHGKLAEHLFETGKISYVFLGDISAPSLEKAVKLMKENNRNFDYAVGDGLQKIKQENKVEEVIICGMGGLEIISILKNNKTQIKDYVLQPQNNEFELKKFLIKNNYKIEKDLIVKDKNIYYNILKVVIDDKRHKITKFALRFGEDNFNGNLDFIEYLKYLQEKYIKLLLVVPLYKRIEIKKELKMVKKAYKKWERSNERNIAIPKN